MIQQLYHNGVVALLSSNMKRPPPFLQHRSAGFMMGENGEMFYPVLLCLDSVHAS